MINLILADSEIELLPDKLEPEEEVEILDSQLHREFLDRLPNGQRRGRPDIVYFFLFQCLDSRLNKRNRINVFVHTRDDLVISVEPGTEVPWNYLEFLDIMGSLLKGDRAPEGFHIEASVRLNRLLDRVPTPLVVMSPEGRKVPIDEFFEQLGEDYSVVIGGFPKGDYTSNIYDRADRVISLGEDELKVWTVTGEVLSAISQSDYQPLS